MVLVHLFVGVGLVLQVAVPFEAMALGRQATRVAFWACTGAGTLVVVACLALLAHATQGQRYAPLGSGGVRLIRLAR